VLDLPNVVKDVAVGVGPRRSKNLEEDSFRSKNDELLEFFLLGGARLSVSTDEKNNSSRVTDGGVRNDRKVIERVAVR
jgi:hypothetical protein